MHHVILSALTEVLDLEYVLTLWLSLPLAVILNMTILLALGLLLAPLWAQASHGSKHFSAEDMLSAPRPQAPVPNYEGTQAISVVDNWDPVKDK